MRRSLVTAISSLQVPGAPVSRLLRCHTQSPFSRVPVWSTVRFAYRPTNQCWRDLYLAGSYLAGSVRKCSVNQVIPGASSRAAGKQDSDGPRDVRSAVIIGKVTTGSRVSLICLHDTGCLSSARCHLFAGTLHAFLFSRPISESPGLLDRR